MKKLHLSIYLTITLVFISFTMGFFLGRNQNRESIYLAQPPTSARHDYAPTKSNNVSYEPATVSFPVDLNSAGLDELTALPGIGQSLAQRILDYRAIHGSFEQPEELLNIEGIGAGKLEGILDYVITGG